MSALMITSIVLGSIPLITVYSLKIRKDVVRDAHGHFKAQLNQRFNLISLMLSIVKVHIPEYGLMLEKVINLRIKSAKEVKGLIEEEINNEIFELLYNLIHHNGYHTENDKHLREQFHKQLETAEKNIKAAYNFYSTCIHDFNKFSNSLPAVLKLSILEIENYPHIKIQESKSKPMDQMLEMIQAVG